MTEQFMKRRKELGLTQRQIAEAVGVTVQTISNWETGLYNPKLTLD
ncbi:Putative transcriptional regulator (fragment) [Hyella patelloides LEGE 07179]|uniref:Transcriptional regulator n=1 Tax=Hyella patelloides LEGE 07179 TaxID=945734 RepID=A0A563VY19_9CYAN